MITQIDPAGTPDGVYDVSYYYVNGGAVRQARGGDTDVAADYLDRLRLEPHEIARAVCQSQSGGAMIFGSWEARKVWDEHEARQVADHQRRAAERAGVSVESVDRDSVTLTRAGYRYQVPWEILRAAARQDDQHLADVYSHILREAEAQR